MTTGWLAALELELEELGVEEADCSVALEPEDVLAAELEWELVRVAVDWPLVVVVVEAWPW